MDSSRALAGERLRQLPFPAAPAEEALADLHARLADYDGHVAGYLSRLQSGEIKALPQELYDHRLEADLRGAVQAAPESAEARALLSYFGAIAAVLPDPQVRR